jgi:Rieske Fe-S protein
MRRRTFITSLLASWLVPTWARARNVALPFAKLKPLHTVGGSIAIKVKGLKLLLIRDAEDSVIALDPTCTHEQCDVRHKSGDTHIRCKCHKSRFDLDGTNISGPAPRPLTRYESRLSDARDRLLVVLPD